MKILVTGASGFIGSWLCRVLSQENDVVALMRESSTVSRLQNLSRVTPIRADVRLWPSVIREQKPEIVILNDWWGVGNDLRNDPRQFENLERMHGLAEAAISVNTQTLIGVGSQAELGPVNSAISESALDNPTTLYGEAKVGARRIIHDLSLSTEVRFIWMRIFSTYGPLDEGAWLIPKIVDSLTKNEILKMTKGEQIWSYLHAYDLALAFAKVIQSPGVSGVVNVGNPETISIREAGSIIGNYLGKEELLKFGDLEYRSDQVMKLQPLCETLINAGWFPQISFDQGIKQTIDWLQRKNLKSVITKNGESLDFKLPLRP